MDRDSGWNVGSRAGADSGSGLYGAVRSLPLTIEGVALDEKRIETDKRAFERTVIELHGDSHVGFGEDVTPDVESHERLRAEGLALPSGTYTVETVSARLDDESGAAPPSQAVDGPNRRWAVESAALDLALKQAGETLASALDRTYEPVRFVRRVSSPYTAFVNPIRPSNSRSMSPLTRAMRCSPNSRRRMRSACSI